MAANSLGIPDLGISTMEDVLIDARRITDVTTLPLLVDIDTGWGGAFDTCPHHPLDGACWSRRGPYRRPGRHQALWPSAGEGSWSLREEMVDRIKAAVDARTDQDFVIMARTDALAGEGLAAALDRCVCVCCRGRGHDLCRGGHGVWPCIAL